MLIISHRGNLEGIDHYRENSPDYIDEALSQGYDVEIDLRIQDGKYYLGHDYPQYEVSYDWIHARKDNLWIHAKDYESTKHLMNELYFCKWFAHYSDKYCLTSSGHLWLHDFTVDPTHKCIVPLLSKVDIVDHDDIIACHKAYAVCTDYPNLVKDLRRVAT